MMANDWIIAYRFRNMRGAGMFSEYELGRYGGALPLKCNAAASMAAKV